MELGQSLEDYLEAAYLISEKHPTRNIDIAVLLNRSKPSVSVAMKELVKKGYALKDSNGNVCLTEKGKELAKNVYERHQYYKNLLIRAGVDPETAEKEGCALEHVLSNDSHRKLEKYIRDLERDN